MGAVGRGVFAGVSDIPFNNVAGWIAASVTNSTAAELSQFSVTFNGEQWRDGGNDPPEAQSMVFQYGFGTSFATVGTWSTPGGNFNWTSPVGTTSAGAVNGNAAGLVANRGGTITNLTWRLATPCGCDGWS